MATMQYHGIPYHLWNPFTALDKFLPILGFGPTVITRGEGPYVFDDRGRRYINSLSSLWNVAVGLGRRELVDAASKQMQELAFASCFSQVHPRAIELAAKLVEITGGRYQHVYLGSTGSEATETAFKMARQYHRQSPEPKDRGRFKVVSLRHSYHGVGYGATSTAGLAGYEDKFGPLVPGFVQIEPPYCYRCPYGKTSYPECGLECAMALERAIQTEGPETVGAFVVEPVMGSYGVVDPPEEYFKRTGETCRRHGVLFIVDEVTTGFGRTGKLFASAEWNPAPDILCLSKAISSGYLPLSATLATETIYERFRGAGNQFEHGCTASGHPVCAAVGLANIDIILREKLSENAARVGQYLKTRLAGLMGKRPLIGDVRGRGLMVGIELVKDRVQKTELSEGEMFNIVADMAVLGVIAYSDRSFIAFFPPLIISEEIADRLVEVVDQVLDESLTATIARKARLAKEFAVYKLG
jgi:adenosylmethionine-8-amino-7-oxononanoate aminotransferase